MNRVVSGNQSAGFAVLNWGDDHVSARLGEAPSRRRVKVPVLRIVRSAVKKEDLFKYATGAKASSGVWETIVYVALGVCAVGAVAMAFFGG